MATNNFKPFGNAAGANVISQADYEALAALASGFTAGKASSAQINKVLRQSTVMAYVLAQFISDSASVDVLDNGSPASILANLKSAITSLTTGRLLNTQFFVASGTYTPTPGTKKIKVILTGGGASGGKNSTPTNYARSGGAAGTRIALFNVPAGTTSIIIGQGGAAAATTGAVGNPGGDSSFGSLMAALGGTTSIVGGGSSGLGFGVNGGNGSGGGAQSNSTIGGVSYWGGGGVFDTAGGTSTTNLNARAYGSGGAGCSNTEAQSGSGMSGICHIEEYS